MPRWVVICANCNQDLTHSKVAADSGTSKAVARPWLGEKPDLPKTGIKLECPNCKTTSVYHRHQLIYRPPT